MIRCVANNYSMLSFWRGWHRSYNLWLIRYAKMKPRFTSIHREINRYIYIPMEGGSSPLLQFRNSVLIFTFVALWHDLSFRLLAWGWLVCLFILPEVIGRIILPPSKFLSKPWYRHVCALAGAFNCLLMTAANLVGFVIGLDGLQYFLDRLLGTGSGEIIFPYPANDLTHFLFRDRPSLFGSDHRLPIRRCTVDVRIQVRVFPFSVYSDR